MSFQTIASTSVKCRGKSKTISRMKMGKQTLR